MTKKTHTENGKKIPSFQAVANVIGIYKALLLANQWPTTQTSNGRNHVIIYVSTVLCKNLQMMKIIGLDDTKKLVEVFGGEELHLATGRDIYNIPRNLNIVSLPTLSSPTTRRTA